MFPVGLKAIAYVLAFLLALYAVPTNVYAEIIDAVDSALDSTSDNVGGLGSADSETPADKAVFEVLDRREETVKHFRDTDGSYVAAQYNYPVHELDANGEWQDIDNTLAESGSEYATPNARVKFAKKITGSETLFTLHDGNRKITMSMAGANKKVAGQVTNTHTEFDAEATKLQKMMTLDKLSSRILYPEILDDVDLEYVVQPDSIKENIIVKEKGDEYRYSFDICLNNLVATLQEDGSVCIADPDTNEVVYVIPAGYMFDGAGEYSDAVQYELIDNGSGKYTLTVTADAEWINADERVFPVTIDPTIEYDKYDYGDVIESTYVTDSSPSTSYYASSYTYAGYSSGTGNSLTFVKMNTFPEIPSSATITNATLNMNVYSVSGSPVYIGVYQVTSNWNSNSLTYSNKPSVSTTCTDYQRITTPTSAQVEYKWDITSFVKSWYDGDLLNYGVMLKSLMSQTSTNRVTFKTERNSSFDPAFIISYQDTKGLEGYYSYYSASADMAGSGHVNAMTGALTFVHSSMSTTDELLPYSVSLVYNSALSGKYYSSSNALTTMSGGAIGYGFKMSYDETIRLTTAADYEVYIWADSDGTEHYFTIDTYELIDNGARYCDEDGLGIYLYLEGENGLGTGYQIRDDFGNIKRFTNNGYLDYVQDVNGNKRRFVRNASGRLVSISLIPNGSAEIPQLSMTYRQTGLLETITNAQTGMVAKMYYSSTYNGTVSNTNSGFLRKIIYTYATGYTYTVTFEYNAAGNLIVAKDLKTGVAVHYTYTSGKVSTVSQYAEATETSGTGNMTLGKKASISYGAMYSQYTSAKETPNTSDDVTTYYQFDPSGRAISAYSRDANHLYGASSCDYDDSTIKTQNAVSSVLQIGTDTVNYLLNPGFEKKNSNLKPENWSYTGSIAIVSNASDSRLRMDLSSSNKKSTISQVFKLQAGTYTASAMFERNSNPDPTNVAKSKIIIRNNDGTEIASSNEILPYRTESDTLLLQEQASVTFTVTGTECYTEGWTLEIVTEYIAGLSSFNDDYMHVDSVMLEKSIGASRFSWLGNGGFENSSASTDISEWTLSGAQRSVNTQEGRYSISVQGDPANQAHAYNSINFARKDASVTTSSIPESYVISGWAYANSALANSNLIVGQNQNNPNAEPVFALKAVVHYMGISDVSIVYIPFNHHYIGWQFATGVVSSTMKVGDNYRLISSIDVYCCYDYNINTAYFDNISVIKNTDCGTTYEYNEAGYVSSVTSSDGNGVIYTYAANGVDVIEATSTSGADVQVTYDSKHRVLLETNESGPNKHNISYFYDDYGNVTMTTLREVGNTTNYFTSSAVYSTSSTNFGAVLASSDTSGRISRMFYDSKARLIGSCANDGTGLIYTYDSYGRVTTITEAVYDPNTDSMQVVSGGTSVSNTYNESARGVLSAITTATASYSFIYDVFGNMISISVNGNNLSTNSFASNNGNLTKAVYGNGFYVHYTYDNLDRITEIRYNKETGTPDYSYTYNANGDLFEHRDNIQNEAYTYFYDQKRNVTKRSVQPINADNTLGEVTYIEQFSYDEQGRLDAVTYNYTDTQAPLSISYQRFNYDETNNVTSITHGSAHATSSYGYDSFGRLSDVELKNGNSNVVIFDHQYSYFTNTSSTPNQLQKDGLTLANGTQYNSFYKYDKVGNIISIEVKDASSNTIQKFTYEYDGKSQLIRENLYFGSGNSLNRTLVYTYDNSGNILSKKKYTYTEAESVSGSPTIYSYGYENAWKDQLTSYNGRNLEYDTIGNPIEYGTYSYEWEQGRQLSSISNSSTGLSVSYQYNDEGIRTVKIVNGVRHEYDVVGDQINREVIHSSLDASSPVLKDIRYYYDASGRPVAIRAFTRTSSTANFTDTIYYLQTNLQGDVVGIYNASGTKIYEYAYDAWGNIIKSSQVATGGNAAHAVNPFRYRGYYYDTETGLYYLQSRYYNPEWGRFLNADSALYSSLLGYNFYVYCANNPVMLVDYAGKSPQDIINNIYRRFSTDFSYHSEDEEAMNNSSPARRDKFANYLYIVAYSTDLGQGWKYRIEITPGEAGKRHIHVYNKQLGKEYAQNEDGSPHDDMPGSPPKWVRNKLKDRDKWDWDSNEDNYYKSVMYGINQQTEVIKAYYKYCNPFQFILPHGSGLPLPQTSPNYYGDPIPIW